MATGTYSIEQLIEVNHLSAVEFGLDTIADTLRADVAAHNEIVSQNLSDMCAVTTDRRRIYGASQDGEMTEVDEFGKAQTVLPVHGADTEYPLRKFQRNVGWTNDWLATHTPADMALAVEGAKKAHLVNTTTQIKRALFMPANYSYVDQFDDLSTLSVKRMVNADGDPIPDGPNGETFDGSTHTHYTANATLTATVATALVDNVVEHGFGTVRLAIARANEAAWRALTGFEAYTDSRLSMVDGDPVKRLNYSRIDNRPIGIYGAAEVWVKPWVPAGYATVFSVEGMNKPLVFREHPTFKGLRIVAANPDYPLYVQFMESYMGVGAWTRTAAACLDFTNASYTSPF